MGNRAEQLGIGIAVMLIIAIVGFKLYESFTGKTEIGQVFVFGLLGISALGLVRLFIASGEKTLTAEDFISIIILIGAAPTALFLMPKFGINLFSAVNIGGSANFDVNVNLTGNVIEWIRKNVFIVSAALIALFVYRKKIAGFIGR